MQGMRTRRAAANFASSTTLTVVTLVTGLIATPLLLQWLGEERFGAFRTASDWYAYLLLLEMGLGGALLALFARAAGRNDPEAVGRIVRSGARRYLMVSVGIIAVGFLLTLAIPTLVPVSPQYVTDLRLGAAVGLLAFLWLPFSAPFRALLEARQRAYWLNGLLLVQTLAITGLALLFAYRGMGITGQFLAIVLGGLAFNIPLVWLGLRDHPGFLSRKRRAERDPEIERRLTELNRPSLVLNLCGRLSVQTDNILLAMIMGPAMVVPLFITQRLAVLVQGQLQGIGNASWAGLAELHFQGFDQRFSQRLLELTSLVGVLGVAALTPIVVHNRFFVELWVGLASYGGATITLVAALNAYLMGIFSLWSWCFSGTGRLQGLMWCAVGQTAVNLALSIFLTLQIGLAGPLVGTLGGFLAVSIWYFPGALRRHFGVPIASLARASLIPLASSLPFAAALHWLASTYPPGGWFSLLAHMGLGAVAYLAIASALALNGSRGAAIRHQMWATLLRRPA
jgi:O-antigen/teichoic acid export membrane protein